MLEELIHAIGINVDESTHPKLFKYLNELLKRQEDETL
jgi:hypothetical protein